MKLLQRLAIGYVQTKFKLLTGISKRKAAEQAFTLFSTQFLRSKRSGIPKNAEVLTFQFKNLNINGYRWTFPQDAKVLILTGFDLAAYNFESYA